MILWSYTAIKQNMKTYDSCCVTPQKLQRNHYSVLTTTRKTFLRFINVQCEHTHHIHAHSINITLGLTWKGKICYYTNSLCFNDRRIKPPVTATSLPPQRKCLTIWCNSFGEDIQTGPRALFQNVHSSCKLESRETVWIVGVNWLVLGFCDLPCFRKMADGISSKTTTS